MTIDKAIETLQDILKCVVPGDPPEEHDAIKLGIEALAFIKQHRSVLHTIYTTLLPGEAKD